MGEQPTAALEREILEECGIVAHVLKSQPTYVWATYHQYNPSVYPKKLYLGYHAEFETLDFTPSDECIALDFFDRESAQAIELFPNVAQLFEFFDPNDFV